MVSVVGVMEPQGKEALLIAFDRLFDRASNKLNLQCTAEEKDEAKQHFAHRYAEALDVLREAGVLEIPENTITHMETAIDELSPAHIAGYLAAGPLALQVQESMRTLAMRAAEQRLIEHLVSQADDKYGGN